MKFIAHSLFLTLFLSCNLYSQEPVDKGLNMITRDALQAQLGFLASDWTEGRETGERGAFLAADYIASMLKLYGVKPAGDIVNAYNPASRSYERKRTYFQSFALQQNLPYSSQSLEIVNKNQGKVHKLSFEPGTDFNIAPSYPGLEIESEVVFVGYGYRNEDTGYDDFKNTDIEGKIILRLTGVPEGLSVYENDRYAAYRISRDKDRIATELGAAAILEADPRDNGMRWTTPKPFMNMSPSESGRHSSRKRYSIPDSEVSDAPVKAYISKRTANAVLSRTGKTLENLLRGKRTESLNTGAIVKIKAASQSELVHVRNVIGMIEGKKRDEIIVIGAHYDHVGMVDGYINNGADDNGSGTVGVMTMARAIQACGPKPEKTIIFALWTGEEKGLLGSRYFVDNPTVPLEHIVMNLNFDMISRYVADDKPDDVTVTYTESYPYFQEITERYIEDYNIELKPDYVSSPNPPGGSDHRSFVAKGIPILRFKPGHREEYHTPADEYETIDWDIMEKIIKISFLDIWDLANNEW